jgi:A/G-specific adenine glycosylase
MSFGSTIIKWYASHKRDLPWRDTQDPYLIWLSEIILQQTRVDQGLPYYYRFADAYPTVASLAAAPEGEVLRLWQGLGYYTRAKNLRAAARQIVDEYGGKFPRDYQSIRSLPGIGDYTAAAIVSFAYGLEYPVVDGNVFRLLSRYFGFGTPIDTAAGKKEFTALAAGLLAGFPPAVFNQAIMEFGAVQCRPGLPDCAPCPLRISCLAYKQKTVARFPVKKGTTKTRNRFFHYLVLRKGNNFFIRERKEKDIWQGLHDFPLYESPKRIKHPSLHESAAWKKLFGRRTVTPSDISPEFTHVLSHQKIFALFYEFDLGTQSFDNKKAGLIKVNPTTIKKYAIPRLVEKYLAKNQN